MKLGLQIGLGLFSLVPLYFAVVGIMTGAGNFMSEETYPASIDNQLRYLSAIYLLVTMLLWWIIADVENRGLVLLLVCTAVFIGGLARFLSYSTIGPGLDRQFAGMIAELCVPIFVIWQRLVARKAAAA